MVTREEIEGLDFEKLAEAIIVHSARQYCTAFKKLLRNPHCRSAINAKKENEEFFRSEWFKTLANANIDPDAMIARLIDKAKSDAKYERTKRSPTRTATAERSCFAETEGKDSTCESKSKG